MTHLKLLVVFLLFLVASGLMAAPTGSFAGSFPVYTFEAFCADPAGETIIFGITACNFVDIDYTGTGTSTIFANASFSFETLLVPALPGPFPFEGTFLLTNLDDPADTIFGSLIGAGVAAGPPGPPVGFPPFSISALFQTTGGTGSYAEAVGSSRMNGSALFTFLNDEATFASGEGSLSFNAVPEPGSALLLVGCLPLVLIAGRARLRRAFFELLQSSERSNIPNNLISERHNGLRTITLGVKA